MFNKIVLAIGLSATSTFSLAQTNTWEIQRLGLTDSAFTRSDGYQYSYAQFLNEQGRAAGYSTLYSGLTVAGQASWVYNGNSTQRIGLTGSGYIRADGYAYSTISYLANQGQVFGLSQRYNNSSDLGKATWLFDGTTTKRLGFYDSLHTRNDGYQESLVYTPNQLGQALGWSTRYNSTTGNEIGRTTWFYNGNSVAQVGLTGSAFTGPNGQHYTTATMNNLGQVAGSTYGVTTTSYRGEYAWFYNGSQTVQIGLTGSQFSLSNGVQSQGVGTITDEGLVFGYATIYSSPNWGYAAWVYDSNNNSTTRLGLTGGAFTSTDGSEDSFVRRAAAHYAAGESRRYSGSTTNGQSAWIYNLQNSSYQSLGLVDSTHIRSTDGWQVHQIEKMNSHGQVVGNSDRFSGADYVGQSAWLYDGIQNIQIGLNDSSHTSAGGDHFSQAVALNEQGQVAGYSSRTIGQGGYSAWIYDGSETKQIGLTGEGYATAGNYEKSLVEQLNNQGQVTGFSERYSGSQYLGQSAWFYDTETGQLFDLTQSVSVSNGFAFSEIEYLGEDGLALGSYMSFDGNGTYLGSRAFYFTVAGGSFDITSMLLASGLDISTEGWAPLANAIRGNGLGQVLGQGTVGNNSQGVYLLTPVSQVPVPASAWLFGSALFGMLRLTRRK